MFLRRGVGVEDKETFFLPLEPAVVCLAFVHYDGHSELKSKLELAVNITNKQLNLTKRAFR